MGLEAREAGAAETAIAQRFGFEEPWARGLHGFVVPSPASASRISRRAACRRVQTVPIGIASSSAISGQVSPSTSARSSVMRLLSLSWAQGALTLRAGVQSRARVGRRLERALERRENLDETAEGLAAAAHQLCSNADQPGAAGRAAVVAIGALGDLQKGRVQQVVDIVGVARDAGDEQPERRLVAIVSSPNAPS